MKIYFSKYQSGFGLVEVIVAVAIFTIIAATGTMAVLGSFSTNRLGDEETEATLLAQEGIEAVRSIRNQDWSTSFIGTDCTAGCGLDSAGGSWVWSGTNNVFGKFTRTVTVTQAQRDISNNIVTSGGTIDNDTYQVISTVDWDFTPTRNNTVELTTYLTNFIKAIGGDWANPVQVASLDLPGNNNGWKIDVAGNYVYLVRLDGNPDFVVIDVSNPASPVQVGSLSLNGTPRNIVVSGSYAYVASADNSQELQIVNISNPAAPSLVGSLNLSRRANAFGVDIVGSTVYLSRDGSNRDELYVIDVSNPSAPNLQGSVNLGTDANEVIVLGSYAYIASDSDSQELQVINVSNPAVPSLVGSLALTGGDNGETITGVGSTIILGRLGGDVHTISVSSPSAPALLGTYNVGANVRDVALGNNDTYVFVGNDSNAAELQIIDISNLSAPSLVGFLNTSPNSDIDGVVYSQDLDTAFGAGEDNSSEFIVVTP